LLCFGTVDHQSGKAMKFIVKFFPEICIKSKSVRKMMVKQLRRNLTRLSRDIDADAKILTHWDFIEIVASESASDQMKEDIALMLQHTPGIAQVMQVKQFELSTDNLMHDIYEKTHAMWANKLKGKTFCVRVKRSGDHDFSSIEVERYVGGGLNQNTESGGVKLKNPDITVHLEIKQNRIFIVDKKLQGLGGYPIGTQDTTMTLISGGFDSTVAVYLMMKRGIRSHFVFFNLGGRNHEIGVKEVSRFIWEKYGSSHEVRFITVPFEEVVGEILTKINNSYMGVALKRYMLRVSERIADDMGIDTLVTGEAVAQVSSQTMTNLKVIDDVTSKLILRPLIVSDKQDIIDTSKRIGTYDYAASIPEYCGVISDKPTTCAKMDKLLKEEARFDMAVLDRAFENTTYQKISEVGLESVSDLPEIEEVTKDAPAFEASAEKVKAVVIDIRHPEEIEKEPLEAGDLEIIQIPFFSVAKEFAALDQSKEYLLYCDKGVMSKLQAVYIKEAGFENIKVFRK
jgi:tRNA uracil 4-sulfurtransferase